MAKVRLSRFFERRGWHVPPAMYAYDFGDDWEHVLVFDNPRKRWKKAFER